MGFVALYRGKRGGVKSRGTSGCAFNRHGVLIQTSLSPIGVFIIRHSPFSAFDMSLRLALPRQALRRCDPLRIPRCMSTTTPRRESVVGKVQNIASQVTEAVKSGVTHTEQYEGVQEEGLRMLMFGKPGSGKVSLLPFVWRNARSVLWSVG
jgi:hypothetical protein